MNMQAARPIEGAQCLIKQQHRQTRFLPNLSHSLLQPQSLTACHAALPCPAAFGALLEKGMKWVYMAVFCLSTAASPVLIKV
jgi:hypothetical protein